MATVVTAENNHQALALNSALTPWTCFARPPAAVRDPSQLAFPVDNSVGNAGTSPFPAHVPGTVASAFRANKSWDFQTPPDLDGQDWWYRTTFNAPQIESGQPAYLEFDGLASLAEVWLNGQLILTSNNMFRAYRVEVADHLQSQNELVIAFRSLTHDLKVKRPRPRWKTNLVNQQQLRWLRTSLLGRIPGWSPPVPAIGPWRAIRLATGPLLLSEVRVTTTLDGDNGIVSFSARVESTRPLNHVQFRVGSIQRAVEIHADANGYYLRCELRIAKPLLWWPHTHGSPSLYDCELTIETDSFDPTFQMDCGKIGFRQLSVANEDEFAIRVNGTAVYCRGACWTTNDIFTLDGTEESLRHDLTLARDAGVNMLRVGGTMAYESDSFYRLCDELGIFVWQDFMFANMDYPIEDAAFSENITSEAQQQLRRLASHPCVAVYCGNSEIEQQAAMLGMPRELWSNRWFAEQLPALCAQNHPGTVYVPSTPTGGILPFHTSSGLTHYYGIGAYLRSPKELRSAQVKFTPECLGFSNLPEPETIDKIMGDLLPVTHHPRWKQRVPRDTGAGWDFEDVRDFYVKHLYDVDPVERRSFDMPRYLHLGRVASGEMMSQAFAEWRSIHSHNAGALIWFFKDLWPAAGWGIVDSEGVPKAAYYFLRRMWQTRQITLTDEGLNGLHLHLLNETAEPIQGHLEVTLLKEPHTVVAQQQTSFTLKARTREMRSVDQILGSFFDVTYAYRFGPPKHDVVVAAMYDHEHRVLGETFHFVRRREPPLLADVALQTEVEPIDDGRFAVTLSSNRFLHAVRLQAKGYLPDDNYFHLMPSRKKTVVFSPAMSTKNKSSSFQATIEALNLDHQASVSFRMPSP